MHERAAFKVALSLILKHPLMEERFPFITNCLKIAFCSTVI
jgi:hypothetical protein